MRISDWSSDVCSSDLEHFSVGGIDFDIDWDALEAGFANRGSTEEKPTVRLANGMPARIWYLPIDGPDKPPRIVRIDLASVGWAAAVRQPGAGTAVPLAPRRNADTAGVLSAGSKARTDSLLAPFYLPTGRQRRSVTSHTHLAKPHVRAAVS